jgi:branched-chain amino acid transport system ATP-binding protein
MLTLRDVEVAYGQAVALRDVSMDVPAGSTVSLVGSNGSGKTTLVHTVLGMLAPRAGTIMIDGVSLTEVRASDMPELGVGLVPEGRRIFPNMSVADNLRMGAHHPATREGFREGLAWVEELFPILTSRRRQRAGTMSGGEQQMVALGRALVGRPKLLVLDEPSLGLAPVIVGQMFEAIERVAADGVTILIAEQNVHKALSISSYGYVLDTGSIVLEGPAAELADTPKVRTAYLGG